MFHPKCSLPAHLVFAFALFSSLAAVGAPQEEESPPASKRTNALADETSPYLLMHAHNPVDWYPWGEEALKKAKDENKPIFLSIGYSSCHWCHVMERESFMDDEIAAFLNDHFVCIKVDREERPDIDGIYMESLSIINQLRGSGAGGGWPLSMFLTPAGEPFFGGTYFPARDGDRGVGTGFLTLVEVIQKNWVANRERIQNDADIVTELTRKSLRGTAPPADAKLQRFWLRAALQKLESTFDPAYGGFRYDPNNPRIPKFPEPSNLLFLVDRCDRSPEQESVRNMLVTTCDQMARGGIWDHLGGGFHRYSVDRFWEIPHFEKMLYDNGQLASVYAELYRLTGDARWRLVVEELLDWVAREMTSAEGGFYSALDAESEGEEGKFYRWSREEVQAVLAGEEYEMFAPIYGTDREPNFEEEWYALRLTAPWAERAEAGNTSPQELWDSLIPIRKKLLQAREQRPRPLLDTKILTAWNGMMIRGFADAGRLLDRDDYLETASRAAQFALDKLVRDDGSVYRTHTAGESKLSGYLDDYACLIEGLLALHRATGEAKWLDAARRLQAKQDELFLDTERGGYFFTASNQEQLLVRSCRFADGALPAGNSVTANNLLDLAAATGQTGYRDRARQTALASAELIDRYPSASPRMLIAIERLLETESGSTQNPD